MSFSITIDGTDLLNELFTSYEWMDNSRADPSPMTPYPPKNTLLQNTSYPPDTIFEQLIESSFKEYKEAFKNLDKSKLTYSINSKWTYSLEKGDNKKEGSIKILITNEGIFFGDKKTDASDFLKNTLEKINLGTLLDNRSNSIMQAYLAGGFPWASESLSQQNRITSPENNSQSSEAAVGDSE